MQNFSKTYAAAIAMMLGYLLRVLGVEAKDEELVEAISALLVFLGFVGVLVERFKRGGLHWSGRRLDDSKDR